MTFQESDLQFDFSATHWQVMKYDTHRYYKILSGAGLKGVDFVGIYKEEQLVFFEIKHFRTNQATDNASFLLFEDTDLFVQNISDKMADTHTAIKVIIKYLNRKVWYRYFLKLEQYIPTSIFQQQDWYFWHKIHHFWESESPKSFILWLEIDPNYLAKANDEFMVDLQKKLNTSFESFDIQPIIASRKKPILEQHLNVKKGI